MNPFLSSFQVDSDLELKAYYAGHVLGAAMFQIRVQNQSVVYTVGEEVDCATMIFFFFFFF